MSAGKQKVSSTAAKRLKRTRGGKGKVVSRVAARNHLLLQKSKKKGRTAKNLTSLPTGEAKKAKGMGI